MRLVLNLYYELSMVPKIVFALGKFKFGPAHNSNYNNYYYLRINEITYMITPVKPCNNKRVRRVKTTNLKTIILT